MSPMYPSDEPWPPSFGDSSSADSGPVILDHKMTWLRKHGVVIFKNRGDVGPQKLYLNPHNSVSLKDSWKRQRWARSIFVNQEFDLTDLIVESFGDTMTYQWNKDGYYIRVSSDTIDVSDNGNTAGIIERYAFEYPVWFNIVFEEHPKLQTQYIAHNCVMDWYELHNFLNHTGPLGCLPVEDAIGPFEALQRVHPKVTLFANGPLFKDDQTEFAYLAELST